MNWVGVVGLGDQGIVVWFPAGTVSLSALLNVSTGFGVYPATYSVGTDDLFSRSKATGV